MSAIATGNVSSPTISHPDLSRGTDLRAVAEIEKQVLSGLKDAKIGGRKFRTRFDRAEFLITFRDGIDRISQGIKDGKDPAHPSEYQLTIGFRRPDFTANIPVNFRFMPFGDHEFGLRAHKKSFIYVINKLDHLKSMIENSLDEGLRDTSLQEADFPEITALNTVSDAKSLKKKTMYKNILFQELNKVRAMENDKKILESTAENLMRVIISNLPSDEWVNSC